MSRQFIVTTLNSRKPAAQGTSDTRNFRPSDAAPSIWSVVTAPNVRAASELYQFSDEQVHYRQESH